MNYTLKTMIGWILITAHLAANASPIEPKTIYETDLKYACRIGNLTQVKELIQMGHHPNIMDRHYISPLHVTTDPTIAKYLLNNGANVHAADINFNTKLCLAARNGELEMVQLLIEYGADPNNKCFRNQTALHRTVDVKIAKILMDSGADIEARDKDNNTKLCLAASKGELEMAELLLENGADANTRCANNQTPLHLAASSDQNGVRVAAALILHGADRNPEAILRITPMEIAFKTGNQEFLEFLRQEILAVKYEEIDRLQNIHKNHKHY